MRTPFLPAPGPVSDFFDQAGLGKGPEKLVELVPDASFRDAGEGLGQQGGGLVPRKRGGQQMPDRGPGAVEPEDAVAGAVTEEKALPGLPAGQARPLPPILRCS